MKTRLLIIIGIVGFSLFILGMTFVIPGGGGDGIGEWTGIETGIDSDPDLSPSYVTEFVIKSGLVLVLIQFGFISLILIITHLILKMKKIPSREYLILIAATIMLFIGIPNFIQGIIHLFVILINEHLWSIQYLSATAPFMVIGFVLGGGGIFLLAKSKLIRNFIEGK